MIESLRQISFINRIFNIRNTEWKRVFYSWLLNLLYRVSFVIGWTLIIGLFVSKYGIKNLPIFFTANALFTIAGSFIYALVIPYFRKIDFMVALVYLSVIMLFSAYFFVDNLILFFIFLVLAEALFLVHLKINLSGLIEEVFTPTESERTFPLIESSETIGGIIGGILIFSLSTVLPTEYMVLLWLGIVLLMVPLLYLFEQNSVVKHQEEKDLKQTSGIISNLKSELKDRKHLSYVLGIIFIVILQWFLFNLMEFQYTKAVYKNVSNVIMDGGSGFEHAFIHDLGMLYLVFSISALAIQLFIGSRLITGLGIFGSMLLHPIVTILGLLGLTVSFNFSSAVIAKNNFIVTSSIFLNSYHSSYYAVKERLRAQLREFIDGIIRPLGALIGTIFIILLQSFLIEKLQIFYMNVAMLGVCVLLYVVIYLQQKRYTDVAVNDLLTSTSKREKINAIEILTQCGHKKVISPLKRVLFDKDELVCVRIHVLKSFLEMRDPRYIPELIACLKDENYYIREWSLRALLNIKALDSKTSRYLIYEFDLINNLKKLYNTENHHDIRLKVLKLLTKVNQFEALSFIVDEIKNSDISKKTELIQILGGFKDCSVVRYIKPYLNSKIPKLRVAAIIALSKFKKTRKLAISHLESDYKKRSISKESFLEAVGKMKIYRRKKFCYETAVLGSGEQKLQAVSSLYRLNDPRSLFLVIEIILSEDHEAAKRLRSLIANVHVPISRKLDKMFNSILCKEVNIHRQESELSQIDTRRLAWIYLLNNDYEEYEKITENLN